MIPLSQFAETAASHLDAARTLIASENWSLAAYHCGYAIEIKLKVRAASRRGWTEFPSTGEEFRAEYRILRTHDLDLLLELSGVEKLVKAHHFTQWNVVAVWAPDQRYAPLGSVTEEHARQMLAATERLAEII